jgi:gliding motility-associated-like protein
MLDPAGWPLTDVVFTWSTLSTGQELAVTTPGTYAVTAAGLCLTSNAEKLVQADTCGGSLVMPNVFSPNGDGLNDVFAPMIDGQPTDLTLEIRNRWGQEVYRGSGVQLGWNGKWKGSSVPDGTYFWVVRYGERGPDGSTAQREASGHVTLLGQR